MAGQGDCDRDSDCLGELRCGNRGHDEAMPPGIMASSNSHITGQGDFCYGSPASSRRDDHRLCITSDDEWCKQYTANKVADWAPIDAIGAHIARGEWTYYGVGTRIGYVASCGTCYAV